MQIFIDTATNHVHHFKDDVVASLENGIYTFKAANGMPLEAPATLQPYTPPEPTSDELLANARQLKIAALMRDCSKAIVAGFESSALGSEHDYPYMPTDQNNLAAAATASLSPGLRPDWTVQFWCADSAGVWSHAAHTAAQIQQVMADGVAHRMACSAIRRAGAAGQRSAERGRHRSACLVGARDGSRRNTGRRIRPRLRAGGGYRGQLPLGGEQAARQKDPGGETKFGLSKRANPDLDIASLTIEQAKGVYRRRYWDAVRGDELPYPLCAFVFDAAVNQGTDAAIRTLQKTLGLAPDGVLGAHTLAAARRLNREGQALYLADRALRYSATRNFELDGRGWLKRLFLNAMEA